MEEYLIEMRHITKRFPGIVANDDISFGLRRGEIHALLGENGAGKSTLMSVLFGMYQPEEGEIRKNGQVVKIKNPNDATRLGIGMVHQHFKLVENFTVLDNVILGTEPQKFGFLTRKEARERVLSLSERYGLKIDPEAVIEKCSVGMQQRVELLKMLYRDNEILIFDEPTAVLTPQEISELLQIMKNFAAEGKSILFISHKLNEIMAVANRCSVLCKGKLTGTVDIKETTKEELSHMMVGREVQMQVEKSPAKIGEAVLSVEQLSVAARQGKKPAVRGVSFECHAGEILCLAGIEGNGQSELVYALMGLSPTLSGKILLRGTDVTKASVGARLQQGISFIPEDRHRHGMVLDYSLGENLILKRYREKRFQKQGFLKKQEMQKYANRLIERFDIRSSEGSSTIARSMSGGNQQKAVIARETDREHDLLIAVQPTRGLDVGAIEFVHKQLVECRNQGKAVLLVSLELEEVLHVSDRILVLYEGEIVGEFEPERVTPQELGLAMAGGGKLSGKEKEGSS